jgi:hypothetical protein
LKLARELLRCFERPLKFKKPVVELLEGKLRDVRDSKPLHLIRQSALFETSSMTRGAINLTTIPREKHSDVHLVLLTLQPRKPGVDADERARLVVKDKVLLFRRELAPRHISWDPLRFAEFKKLAVLP